MAIEPPKKEDLKRIAEENHFELSDSEADAIGAMLTPMIGFLDRIDQIRVPSRDFGDFSTIRVVGFQTRRIIWRAADVSRVQYAGIVNRVDEYWDALNDFCKIPHSFAGKLRAVSKG